VAVLAVGLLAGDRAAAAAAEQPEGDGGLWTHRIAAGGPWKDKRGREHPPRPSRCWLPDGVEKIRGVLVCHPVVLGAGLAKNHVIRGVASELGLAIILDGLFTYDWKRNIQNLDELLGKWAEASGHPELVGAPVLTIGHSMGAVFSRNICYVIPDRCLGTIHLKSGNMQSFTVPGAGSLAGVPFLGINGEMEEHGPDGGIQREWGRQTQWIMFRKQLLERRAQDPDHLMSLVVHPGGNHTSWSGKLTRLCALFIRKAVAYRLPPAAEDKRQEGQPVVCRPLKAADGWLSDADIKQPSHAPAAYADYAGDKLKAFWHFDREMAEAVRAYHKDAFTAPDPSRGDTRTFMEVVKGGKK
jgi:hypothetical protein